MPRAIGTQSFLTLQLELQNDPEPDAGILKPPFSSESKARPPQPAGVMKSKPKVVDVFKRADQARHVSFKALPTTPPDNSANTSHPEPESDYKHKPNPSLSSELQRPQPDRNREIADIPESVEGQKPEVESDIHKSPRNDLA
jgi:hypothetical protein